MRRVLGVILLAAAAGTCVPAAAVAATTLPTSQSPQRFGVRLVDVPVSEEHNPRGLRYIIDFLHPGVVIHRRILIVNQEKRTAHFTVYPGAARIKHGYFAGDADHTPSELTSWVTIKHPKVSLGAGASVMDLVTIKVPRIATRGEHYGVVWVQQVGHARAANGFAVKEISRVGTRIYLAVGKGGAPPTRFVITSVLGHRTPKGRLFLTVVVRNTGGRAVDLTGTLRLADGPGGTTAGPFPVRQVITLAPGQSHSVTFVPPRNLPIGPWQANVTLVSGITRQRAQATITFSNKPMTAAWLRPAAVIGGAIGLVALFGAGLAVAARVRRTRGVRGVRASVLRAP